MQASHLSNAGIFILLALATIAAHAIFIPVGYYFHDSDMSVPLLFAEHVRKGEWSAFYFQQSYGGTALSYLRALWVAIYEHFNPTHTGYLKGHMIFSYCVGPTLATWFSYMCAKRYCSMAGALVAGLVTAVSFQGMIQHCGDDFYYAFFIAAPLLLMMASKTQSFFLESTRNRLALGGILCGFMFYTFRGFLIYILAVMVPWKQTFAEARRLLAPRGGLEKTGIGLVYFLLALYLYLDFFGPVIGDYKGRPVKLYPEPNLTIVAAIILLLELKIRYKSISLDFVKRAGIFIAGFATGFLPEIFHRLGKNDTIILGNWETNSLMQALDLLANRFAMSVRQLLLGHEIYNIYNGILKNTPYLLLIFGIWALLRESKRRPQLLPVLIALVLGILAFFRVHKSGAGQYRYLIPVLPVAALMAGILWDHVYKKGLKYRILVALLVAAACSYQLIQRQLVMKSTIQLGKIDEISRVVDYFKRNGVRVVISDEFFQSNHYTFYGREKPFFVSTGRIWGPPEGFELANTEKRVGILLTTGKLRPDAGRRLQIRGRSFQLGECTGIYNNKLCIGVET
ncbi:MAG: hypothetical protein A2583_01345 [Bdellovibrionales bacterium RIFOXYD1_FULL_53_11]|nr:MAG: hypothetical protein A2583_01345 [Bdellovibrionales bacterium RIFOXYD1_FULL_53_11]